MKITLENTSQIETIDGVRCRIWEGETADGIPVFAFIPLIAVKRSEDQTVFERELREYKPKRLTQEFDLRKVL